MLKIPVINNVCGLGTVFLKKGLISLVAIKLYRWAFRYPKKVFFQNSDDRKLFLDRKLVPPAIADLVPGSGVDLRRFVPVPSGKNEKFTFLLISRLITDKGILEFIEAVKQLRSKGFDAKFQLLGPKDPKHKRGIQLKTIDEWIHSGIIEYLGTTDDVRQYINKADCVVLASYREGTPRTLLEAASSGKPIVATDVPGCHHVVIDNYNGLLCKLKDAQDLADKMELMAGLDETKLKEMGANGRKKMELEYGEDIVISKYIAAITPFRKAS
jgi:glycosyltransferase involved in cell wall biosynthesis